MNDKVTLLNLINNIIPSSTIAIHGLTFNSIDEISNLVNNIFSNGLINKSTGGITSNCEICSTTDSFDGKRIMNYAYHNVDGITINIIVNIPYVLDNGNKKYFIGKFKDLKEYQKYDEDSKSIWLNEFVNDTRLLPREFIVGAIISNGKESKFYQNPYFLGKLDKSKQYNFINYLIGKCSDKQIIEIDPNDIDKTYQSILSYIEIYKKFMGNSYYLEQAKEYIEEKYLNNKSK